MAHSVLFLSLSLVVAVQPHTTLWLLVRERESGSFVCMCEVCVEGYVEVSRERGRGIDR